jgi:hypothetical protein
MGTLVIVGDGKNQVEKEEINANEKRVGHPSEHYSHL